MFLAKLFFSTSHILHVVKTDALYYTYTDCFDNHSTIIANPMNATVPATHFNWPAPKLAASPLCVDAVAPALDEVDVAVDELPPAPVPALELPASFANAVSVIGMKVLIPGR